MKRHRHRSWTYAKRGHRRVPGWLDPLAAQTVALLGQWQTDRAICGGVGEIGVHHGRLFLLLDLLRVPPERAFAVDLFDAQLLNVDRSGRGDLDAFLENVDRVVGSHDHISIMAKSSVDVTAEEISRAVGEVRIFSIDGGHTPELTKNDLRLAEATLGASGVAILDDVFNERWPGVATGLFDFRSEGAELVPVGIVGNKTLLVRQGAHADYLTSLLSLHFGNAEKTTSEFLGSPVVVITRYPRTVKGRLRALYAGTQGLPVLGPLARSAAARAGYQQKNPRP